MPAGSNKAVTKTLNAARNTISNASTPTPPLPGQQYTQPLQEHRVNGNRTGAPSPNCDASARCGEINAQHMVASSPGNTNARILASSLRGAAEIPRVSARDTALPNVA
eukprot:1688192-Alexandrium_andersonii.AAC.1